MRPSENFVLTHRNFLFWDEWLWYLVMLILLFAGILLSFWFLIAGVPVLIYGAIAISLSYKRQWRFEKLLLEDTNEPLYTWSTNDCCANHSNCTNCGDIPAA